MIVENAAAERGFEMVQILMQAAASIERAGPEAKVAAPAFSGDFNSMLHDRV